MCIRDRLYIDPEGNERVMAVEPYNTIILYKSEMTEPSFACLLYTSIANFAEMLKVPKENVRIISRTEYKANTEE